MMRKAFLLAAGAALCALTAPATAAAKPIYIEMKGTIDYGYDNLDLFGFGSSLNGLSASLLYEFDTDAFSDPDNYLYEGSSYAHAILGWTTGSAAPAKATITIDGISKSLTADTILNSIRSKDIDYIDYQKYDEYWGLGHDQSYIQSNDSEQVEIGSRVNFYNASSSGYVYSPGTNLYSGLDLKEPLYNPITDGGASGSASFDFNKTVGRDQTYTQTYGSFTLTSFIVGPLAAVPEPSTWALMIVGFGGAGAALRRNRGRRGASGQRLATA